MARLLRGGPKSSGDDSDELHEILSEELHIEFGVLQVPVYFKDNKLNYNNIMGNKYHYRRAHSFWRTLRAPSGSERIDGRFCGQKLNNWFHFYF